MNPPFGDSVFDQAAPGHEHSLRQLMRLAWARFTACFWPAVGSGLLIWLILGGCTIVIGIAGIALGTGIYNALRTFADVGVAESFAILIPVAGGLWLLQVLTKLFMEGLLLACSGSYAGTGIMWSDICRGFTRPWRKPMFAYVALFATIATVLAGSQFIFNILAKAKGIPWLGSVAADASLQFMLAIAGRLLWGAVQAATLLIGLFILSSRQPTLARAIADQKRVLRNQGRRILAIVGLYVGSGFVLSVPQLLLTTMYQQRPLVVCSFFPFMLAGGLLSLYFYFLVAALFRSIHGLPLEPAAVPVYYAPALAAIHPAQVSATGALPPETPQPEPKPDVPPVAPDDEPQQPPAADGVPGDPWPAPRNDPPPWNGDLS